MPTYTVGTTKTYATITAALAAIPSDISGTGVNRIVVDAGTYGEQVSILKTGASAADYIHLLAATGSEHFGNPAVGVRVHAGAFSNIIFNIATNFTRFTNIVTINDIANNFGRNFYIDANNCILINCLAKCAMAGSGGGSPSSGFQFEGSNNECRCCISMPTGSNPSRFAVGFYNTGSTDTGNIMYNCGVYGLSNGFSFASNTFPIIKNCWALDLSSQCISGSATGGVFAYNATSDGTGLLFGSTNSIANVTRAQFAFVDSANLNLHILSTSVLRGVGVNLSSIFTQDIDNVTIESWSIGPDAQFVETFCNDDVFNYSLSVNSSPFYSVIGNPSIDVSTQKLQLTGDDIAKRYPIASSGGYVCNFTFNFTTPASGATAPEFITGVDYGAGFGGMMPSIKFSTPSSNASGTLIFKGCKYSIGSGSDTFGAWVGQSIAVSDVNTTPILMSLYYKASAHSLAATALINGVTYSTGFVVINPTFIDSFYGINFIMDNKGVGGGASTFTLLLSVNSPFHYRTNLSDLEVDSIFNGASLCSSLAAVYLPTASDPWTNNNEPHEKVNEAKNPELKVLSPESVSGLAKGPSAQEAKNPTLKTSSPEAAPPSNTSSTKINEARSQNVSAKKGYVNGFVSVMPEQGGYTTGAVVNGTGNMVYLINEALTSGKTYLNRDQLRPTRVINQRVGLPVTPEGKFVHEIRSNDSIPILQSHFQNRLGTTPASGTTYYEFSPSKSKVDVGGVNFGTGSYVAGTRQAYTVSVFKAINGTGYHFKSGVCDTLKFNFDARDSVQVEAKYGFATVAVVATNSGLPFGSYSTLPNFPGHKCDINFFGLPLINFTFECKNNLIRTAPVGSPSVYYKFGRYEVSGAAWVDIPPNLFQYFATMLANTSFPVYGTMLNDNRDKIIFQMDNCRLESFSYNLLEKAVLMPFKAYESEDGVSPPIKFKVWTRNYSATTFEPN